MLWPNKQGYPELFLKGQWSASGTLNISDIEGVDIGEANLTAQWFDVLTTLNTMPMYGEKVLDGDRGVIYAGDFELTMVDRLSLIPSKGTLFQKGSSDNVMSLELMSGELYLKRECVNGNWVAVLPEVSRQDGVRTVETSLAEPRKEGGTASTDHSGQLNKKNVKKNVKKNGKKSGKKSGKKNGKKSGKRTKSGQTNQHVSHDTLSKKAYYLTVNYICSNDKILSFRAESEYRAPAVNECSTLEGRLAYHLLEHEMTGVLSMSASNAERNAATLLTSEYGRARVIEDRLVVDQFFMSRSSDHIEAPDGYEVVTPILYKVLENGVMDVSYALVNKKVRQPLRQEGNSYEGESLMVQYHGCFDDIDNFQDGIQHVSVRALNRVYVDTSKYFLAMTHSDYNSYFNSDDQRLMLTRIHKGEDSGSVHMEYLTPNGVLNACWSEPFYLLAHNAPVKDPSNKFVMSWKCYAERDIEQSDLELKNHQDLLPFTPLKRTLEKYFQIFSYSTGLVAHVSIKDHSNSGQYLLISSVSSKEQQDGIDLHLEFELGDEKGARFLVSKLEDGEMVVLQEWEEGSGDLRKLQRQLPDSDFYRTHAPKLAEIATVVSRYYLVSQSRLLEGADAVMALDPQPLHLGFGFSR